MSEQEKDNWDKIQIFGLLLIPLIVVILGFRFDASLKRIDSQARMTEIAVGILREAPEQGQDTELRRWAINVVEKYSGVEVNEELRQSLEKRAWPTPKETEITSEVQKFKVTCDGQQLCSDTFTATAYTESRLRLQIRLNQDTCQPLRVHVAVDDEEILTTPYLSWPTASGSFAELPSETRFYDLGPVSPGVHAISLRAEGEVGGCSIDGGIKVWGGSIALLTSRREETALK